MDLDNTLVNTLFDRSVKGKGAKALKFLLDFEQSLLPEQRTLFRIKDGWVKLRPAAREFLQSLASIGQLYVFTMGDR